MEGALFPGALASLNLDLVLAPARSNLLSQSKGAASLLALGACGYPVICSDSLCAESNLPVTAVSEAPSAWIAAIEAHIDHPEQSAQRGDELRREVLQNRMLDKAHLQEWCGHWAPSS
ncbi:hypothetical protein ALQ06_200116 [Pseudomonas syringae pv. berberidis]|nr:hypothetical protein ALQ06_200116 [Pseudomonas syringae pv. berberidis]